MSLFGIILIGIKINQHMKIYHLFYAVFFLSLSSCIPSPVYYLGESYQATDKVDIFFEITDIRQDFKAMGTMTSAPTTMIDLEPIQDSMLAKAREEGADAIVFDEIELVDDCERTIKATLIKYQ